MFGTKHTLKRLSGGVAVVAALGALAVPAGLAGGFQTDTVNSARVANGTSDRGLDPAIATAIAAHQQAGQPVAGFQTDTVNSALVGGGSYGLDPAIATAMAARGHNPAPVSYAVPRAFQTDTVNSARLAPVVERVPADGFDWPSFGIGIGAGVGGLLLLGGVAALVRPQRRLANA